MHSYPGQETLRCCFGLMIGLLVTGCTLSAEPVPVGPVEVGPLPGQATAESSLVPTTPEPTAASPSTPSMELVASGTVTGAVRNGTGDAAVPADLEVDLSGVTVDDAGNISEFFSRSTKIDPDGSFRFENVPFDVPVSAYVAQAIYDGVEFASGLMVNPHSPTMDLSLMIYENTTDPAAISIDNMHLILNEQPEALLVTEVLVFSNDSDRVYVSPEPVAGGRRGSVIIPVADDAYGLRFDEGELGGRFVQVGGLVYDTQQVFPGRESHTVSASYLVPFDGSRQISLSITYSTSAVTILINEGIKVESPVLSDGGIEIIRDHPYHKYLAGSLAAGQSLDMQMQATPEWVEVLRSVLIVLTGALGVSSLAYWLFIARRRGTAAAVGASGFSPLSETERRALLGRIAALDDAHEAGKINRFEWEVQRAELKAELEEKTE